MSKKQQAIVFQPFQQADSSTTRRFGGSGLGLTITKTLLDLMDGEISVESEEQQGSEFLLSLPLEAVGDQQQEFPLSGLNDIKVVVLSENELNRNMALNCLGRMQIEAVSELDFDGDLPQGQNTKTVYLVDDELLLLPSWKQKIVNIQQAMIVMTKINNELNTQPFSDVCSVNKPLMRAKLVDALFERLGIKNTNNSLNQPLSFGQNHHFTANILLVEDSKTNQHVALGMLALLGCSADVADNGAIALEKVVEKQYDLIFMDCQMPIMDGFAATRGIRKLQADGKVGPLIIVALTAGLGSDYEQECIESGMDDCMLKPFTSSKLLETLQKHIGHFVVASQEVKVATPEKADLDTPQLETDNNLLDMSAVQAILDIEKQTGKKLLSRIVVTFEREIEIKLPLLLASFQAGDTAEVVNIAHALKSIAGNVGAKKLREMCQKIEHAGMNNNLQECEATMHELTTCVKQSLFELTKL